MRIGEQRHPLPCPPLAERGRAGGGASPQAPKHPESPSKRPTSPVAPGLHVVEGGVAPTLRDEVLVAAGLDHSAFI